jgi:hypothetical protein
VKNRKDLLEHGDAIPRLSRAAAFDVAVAEFFERLVRLFLPKAVARSLDIEILPATVE